VFSWTRSISDPTAKHIYKQEWTGRLTFILGTSSDPELNLITYFIMATSADSTLPVIHQSYEAISPAKYAGKLQGKVVRRHFLCISWNQG